jgi:hypothetical protein
MAARYHIAQCAASLTARRAARLCAPCGHRSDGKPSSFLVGLFRASRRSYRCGVKSRPVVGDRRVGARDRVIECGKAMLARVALGKAIIVQEILACERSTKLYNPEGLVAVAAPTDNSTWLPHFLSMAVGSLKREDIMKLTLEESEPHSVSCL